MGSSPPPWFGKVDDLDETAVYAAMTPDERLRCFVDVCELARAIIQDRPDRHEVLARADPLSAEAEATWRRLIFEAARARSPR